MNHCDTESINGRHCALPPGHDGDHEAHHVTETWTNGEGTWREITADEVRPGMTVRVVEIETYLGEAYLGEALKSRSSVYEGTVLKVSETYIDFGNGVLARLRTHLGTTVTITTPEPKRDTAKDVAQRLWNLAYKWPGERKWVEDAAPLIQAYTDQCVSEAQR